ncbi:hypothetical protein VTK56DRAFT_7370 [Thermocarpiscus australiensis]
MHVSAVILLSLLGTAFAAPANKVDARQPLNCVVDSDCYSYCAAGIYIDCGASYCDVWYENAGTCHCSCHY